MVERMHICGGMRWQQRYEEEMTRGQKDVRYKEGV
jgi:hypothetical protein